MTKTTYEILNDKINNIGKELCKIGKENNLHRLSLLSGQLGDLKEDIARLLWLELPELNDSKKLRTFLKALQECFSTLVFLKWTLCDKHSLNVKLSIFLTTKQINRHI